MSEMTTESDNLGINYDHTWARSPWATRVRIVLMELILKPVNRFFAPAKVTGLHHLNGLAGPVIFVANHSSHADTSTVLTRIPKRFAHHAVIAAAADYFFDKKLKADFFSLTLNAIPVERVKIDRRSAAVTAEKDLLALAISFCKENTMHSLQCFNNAIFLELMCRARVPGVIASSDRASHASQQRTQPARGHCQQFNAISIATTTIMHRHRHRHTTVLPP
jgi:hypothetical protein